MSSSLSDVLDDVGQSEAGGDESFSAADAPRALSPAELKLFAAMRKRMEDGANVEFKEAHNGELIAIRTVLHRASDYEVDSSESGSVQ